MQTPFARPRVLLLGPVAHTDTVARGRTRRVSSAGKRLGKRARAQTQMSRQDVDAPQRIRRPKVKSSTHRPSPTCSSPRPRGRPDGSLGRPSQQGNVNDAAWPVPPETRVVPSCARTVRDIALGWYRPPRVGRFRKTAVSGTNARGAGDGGSDKLIAWPREGHRIISGQIARCPAAWAQRIFSRGEWRHARPPVLPGPRGVVGNRQDSGHRIFSPARTPNTGKATSSAPSALAASDMETGSPHGVSPGRASEEAEYGRSPLRDRSLRWSCLEEQVLSRSCYRSTFVALRNAFLLVESTRPAPPASSGSATPARAPAPISRFTPGARRRALGPCVPRAGAQSTRPRVTTPVSEQRAWAGTRPAATTPALPALPARRAMRSGGGGQTRLRL